VVGRVSSPQFVGRREELAALEAVLARPREGYGSVVLVAAEAGMGKSRLISELVGRAERNDVTVVVGECVPLAEGELPYAPIVVALRSLVSQWDATELEALLKPARHELAALMPELAVGSDRVSSPRPVEASQAGLFEQLVAVLRCAARAKPLVLVVEDCQWADRSTRDFLVFLVRAARR
jgi:predicted ATPase